MNLRTLNMNLYKLEGLYADNIITLLQFNKGKAKILSIMENDKDLAYDDEMNTIYRISTVSQRQLGF